MSKRKKTKPVSTNVWDTPTGYNVHHRLPKSRGGSNAQSNLSKVPIVLHHAFNALFGSNPTAQEVADILTKTWIDPSYEIIVRRRDGPTLE